MTLIIDLLRLGNAYDAWSESATPINEFNTNATMRNRLEYIERKYSLSRSDIWELLRMMRNPLPATVRRNRKVPKKLSLPKRQ
ncbi:hypothetical protein EBT31_01235 [bacterium]|nr:hypothetical protein [bacterium]NBX48948.1 hypothetical protein [bacterium]